MEKLIITKAEAAVNTFLQLVYDRVVIATFRKFSRDQGKKVQF